MKRLAKRLGLAAGLLAVLVGIAAVVVTRPAFITGVVLPRYARSIQTEIAVGSLKVSPFSRIEARGVRVGPSAAPLLQSDLLRLRYRLWPALIGRLRIDEIGVEGTTLHVLRRADGSTNLPVFPPDAPDDDDDDDAADDDVYDLLLRGVRLEGLTLVYEQEAGPDQEPMRLRLSDLRLELPELRSGADGAVTLSGRLQELTVATLSGVTGRVAGEGRLGLHPTLGLALLDIALRVEVEKGRAGEFDLAGREVRLDLDLSSDAQAIDLRRLAISERHGGAPEAVLTVVGRLQREPALLRLDVVAEPIDAALFDLAGALVGDVSFGAPRAVYRGQVEARSPRRLRRRLSRRLEQPWTVTAAGRFEAQAVQPRSEAWSIQAQTPFDATLSHDLAWDSETGTVELRALSLRAGTAARDVLTAELTAPVLLRRSGGTAVGAMPEAEMRVRARGLPLSAANPFLPEAMTVRLLSGELSGDLTLALAGPGPRCLVNGEVSLREAVLGDKADSSAGEAFGLVATVRGSLVDWRQVAVDEMLLRLRPPFGEAASVRGSGQYDPGVGGRARLQIEGLHENLLPILPPRHAAALPIAQARIDGDAEVETGVDFRPLSAALRLQAREVRLRNDASTGALAGLYAPSVEVRASVQRDAGEAPLRTALSAGAEGIQAADRGTAAAAVSLEGQASWRPGRVEVESLLLRVRDAERVLASVDLTGSAALPPTAGRSDLALNSDVLDLDALAAMFRRPKPAATSPAPTAPAAPTRPEIGPFDTGAAEVVAALSLKDIRYGQARHDLEARAHLRQSVLTLDPVQLHLAGAAIGGRGQVNLAVAGLEYSIEATATEPFAIGPLVRVFAPTLKDSVQGDVTHLQVALAGQGTTSAVWQRHLRGPLQIECREVVLQDVPALKKLSALWSAPELERLQISELALAAHAQDGALHLDSFRESAPEHLLSAQGRLGFDRSLALDLILGVGGSLRQRLQERQGFQQLLRTFVPQGDHVVSPVPISLKGSLDQPRFDRERFFSDVAKVSATTLLQGLVKEKLGERVGDLVKGAVGDNAAAAHLPELIKEKVPGPLGDLLQGVVGGIAPATPAAATTAAEKATPAPAATAPAAEKAAAEKATMAPAAAAPAEEAAAKAAAAEAPVQKARVPGWKGAAKAAEERAAKEAAAAAAVDAPGDREATAPRRVAPPRRLPRPAPDRP